MSRFLTVASLLFSCLAIVLASPVSERQVAKRGDSGTATWFNVGLGNCGDTNVDSDWIVALPTSAYDNGSHCNQKIKVTSSKGETRTAIVKDSCPSCGPKDLDLSPSFFQQFASLDDGVFQMTWQLV